MRRMTILAPLAAVFVIAAGAGCANKQQNSATSPPTVSTDLGSSSAAPATSAPAKPSPAKSASPAAASWPAPEDCVSYNPGNLSVHYEAGIYQVNDGSKVVLRLHGGPGEQVGEQGLALAKRYRKHCFLGRDNSREEKYSYIFDYWRNETGSKPTIPGLDDLCSDYDRRNLTVEDMGDGNGWRVKDHDHVLHLFDNGDDARDGKLVLAKYSRICFVGGSGDESQGQDQVSFS
ncbi:hypothetical protein F4553_001622 [Allocatelliglobosispora scoriae]|uniref:Lipoprotein n=1 Tax=Allocatelliglobosispora scoriae TaxID=643052 RepID=A0A841BMP3_9ACTN|nr:hypothetical protein [Allocatelliglobosispora scoriae]MBB5868243.1 hypothetical protein [Allocatelliglobosispora scoriae]